MVLRRDLVPVCMCVLLCCVEYVYVCVCVCRMWCICVSSMKKVGLGGRKWNDGNELFFLFVDYFFFLWRRDRRCRHTFFSWLVLYFQTYLVWP